MIAAILTGLALAVAGYAFVGYPLIAMLMARFAGKRGVPRLTSWPSLTVVIAARNESVAIVSRLRNVLACSYPPARLAIVVVDDASDDATAEAVRSIDDPRVTLVRLTRPAGKAAALNVAMQSVSSELTVFADARQRFCADALEQLVLPFADRNIGAVAGELQMVGDDGNSVASNGLYWQLERALRAAESELGWAHAASGAIYAIRSRLFRPLPDGLLLDDVYTPLHVVKAGYRVHVARDAIAMDRVNHDLGHEFRRKLRTLAGNWQLLAMQPWLLHPRHNPLLFAWASHKLSRLLAPWALLIALVASGISGHPAMRLLFLLQLVVYALGVATILAPRLCGRIPLASAAGSFLTLNAAALLSLPVYLGRRELSHLWKR